MSISSIKWIKDEQSYKNDYKSGRMYNEDT